MPRFVQSQVVAFVEEDPLLSTTARDDPRKQPQFTGLRAFEFAALAELVKQISTELLNLDAEHYADFVLGSATLLHS